MRINEAGAHEHTLRINDGRISAHEVSNIGRASYRNKSAVLDREFSARGIAASLVKTRPLIKPDQANWRFERKARLQTGFGIQAAR